MKSLLLIAYYFPPMGFSGVQRTVKFAKYLPRFGWEPTILTVRAVAYLAYDPSLLDDLPDDVKIVRTGSADLLSLLRRVRGSYSKENVMGSSIGLNPSERLRNLLNYISQALLLPDNKIGWLPFSVVQGRRLLRERRFDAIYATAPPFSDLLIGRALKRASGLPLIADFRDAWVANQFARYATPLHRLLAVWMERQVLSDADAVITINERIADLLAKNIPLHRRGKLTVIPHGFDPEDFEEMGDKRRKTKDKRGRERDSRLSTLDSRLFTITYTGSFYERITPLYFLRGVRKFLDDQPDVARHLHVVFVGRIRREDERLINTLDLRSVVEVVPYVNHRTSVEYLMNADILWLMIGRGKGSEMISTGKLFEYLGARKPILASIPEEGEAAQIVRASKNGIIVPPDDVEGITTALYEYYRRSVRGLLKPTPATFVERYNRLKLTQHLAEILDGIHEKRDVKELVLQ